MDTLRLILVVVGLIFVGAGAVRREWEMAAIGLVLLIVALIVPKL